MGQFYWITCGDFSEYSHHSQTHYLGPIWMATLILEGNTSYSPKNWTLWSSLSLFLVKYSVFLLVCLQFPIQDHYIHTSRHWKATIRSRWTFFCVCLYECNDPEWETACEQAKKKTGLIQNISLGTEKDFTYDQFQQIVQKLISITNHECNVKWTKTVWTRMDVLKNSNFHYVHDISQNQFHFKICTLCMVTTSA